MRVKWLLAIKARKRGGNPTAACLICVCVCSIRYVVSSLELLVAEDYMIVYLNGATPRRKMPGIVWLKRCYQMIDRKWERLSSSDVRPAVRETETWVTCEWMSSHRFRLRKNLKCLIIVHPTWFIRTVLAISKPFIRWYQPSMPASCCCSIGWSIAMHVWTSHLIKIPWRPRNFNYSKLNY